MTTTVVDVTALTKTEHVQDRSRVEAIARAIGADASEIIWDDQPAIIVDESGLILDGHHRVEAAILSGINVWRALTVSRSDWDAQYAIGGQVHAAKWVAAQADDAITWGAL